MIGPPSAPTGVNATKCVTTDNCVTLTWKTPASDGGSPITGFNACCTSGGGIVVGPQTYPATATGTGKDGFTGLRAGLPYTCTVVSINARGAGPPSAPSNQVVNEEETEAATADEGDDETTEVAIGFQGNLPPPLLEMSVPDTPSSVVGTASTTSGTVATLTWTAPSTGGSTILDYTVSCNSAAVVGSPFAAGAACSSSACSVTLTGLTAGTSYTCAVTATNGVGPGSSGTSSAFSTA